MITEDYVSYEVARLLQEKGFNEVCFACYEYFISGVTLYRGWMFEYKGESVRNTDERVKCPTLQMAMKWLREVHHCYIQVMLDGWASGGHSGYYVVIQKTDSDFEMMLSDALDEVFYKTPEEACKAAIKYCLENLI